MKIYGLLAMIIILSGCNSAKTRVSPGDGGVNPTSSVVAETPTSRTVSITWTAAAGTVQGYLIEKSMNGAIYSFEKLVVGAATTSTTVSGLSVGSTYYFRIRAFNQADVSSYAAATTVSL